MKTLVLSAAIALCATTASAKVWRINNNTGTSADFTQPNNAVSSASVVSGDTLHLEPSSTQYSMGVVSKNLVFIGPGYLLDGSANGNAGLQADTRFARISSFTVSATGAGSRFIGLTIGSNFAGSSTTNLNITFERCRFESNVFFGHGVNTYSNITFRKCFFLQSIDQSQTTYNNLVIENCIFSGDAGAAGPTLQILNPSGTGCIFRNNVVKQTFAMTLANFYVANNIIINGGTGYNNTFTGSNVKNNLFNSTAQTFPVGATANVLGVTEAAVFAGTGSSDARYMLKAGSPAENAGVTVGSVVTPSAGAFGGPDPYKLSGIPAIPTIYSITVPTSIPQGQSTMNVTFSTRSNN